MGSFRVTGGSSFEETMRRAPRLWTNGGRIATCFVESDRNEITVAFPSSGVARLDETALISKKAGGGFWFFLVLAKSGLIVNLD